MKRYSRHRSVRLANRLRHEQLEDRALLAVTIDIGIDLDSDGAFDDVRIVGGGENTTIRIEDEGIGSGSLVIDVDKNGDGDFLDAGDVQDSFLAIADDTSIIELRMGGGRDTIDYVLAGALQGSIRQLSVDLGTSNDTFRYRSGLSNIENGSHLSLDILAGSGNDVVDAIFADILNSEVLYQAALGTGNDNGNLDFSVSGGADVDQGGTFQGNIDLGSGTNILDFDAFVEVGATSSSKVDIDIAGGSNVDTITMSSGIIVGNGASASSISIDIDAAGGNDVLDTDFTLMEVSTQSLLSLSVYGRAGNDTIRSEYVGTLISDILGVVDLDFEGGIGDDIVQVDHNVLTIATLFVVGQLRVHVDGNEGNDSLRSVIRIANASSGNLDIAVYGHAGSDTVNFNLIRGSATATLGRTGRLIVDGGLGFDTLDNNAAAGIVNALYFEIFV